jgi:hypothetical protein
MSSNSFMMAQDDPLLDHANTAASVFIANARYLLMRDYLPKISDCLEKLTKDDIWWRPNENSNSIGNLILHLCGNVRQWIVARVCQGQRAVRAIF